MPEPFDAHKAKHKLPALPKGYRHIWLHLFESRDGLADWMDSTGQKGEDFRDPWEPGAFTDDYDDIYCPEYPTWREVLGIGTLKVVWHELRHIYLNGPDEDGVKNDNDEHHRLFRCAALGLCVGAGHGARFLPLHAGGVDAEIARELLDRARFSGPDGDGIRHACIAVAEEDIAAQRA